MGLILDFSVVIAAERRGETVEQFIEKMVKAARDQELRHLPVFGKLIEDTTVFVQNGQRYRKTKALLLPRFENLEWRTLPKHT